MSAPYYERRNRQIFVLVDRRGVPPKEIPARLLALGFGLMTYTAVRKIISRYRRGHILSHHSSPH